MKSTLNLQWSLSLILGAVLVSGCQKGTITNSPGVTAPSPARIESESPASICSKELIDLVQKFSVNQQQATGIHNQIFANPKNKTLRSTYLKMSSEQANVCKGALQILAQQNSEICFKTADLKTEENSVSKSKIISTCQTVQTWFKKIAPQTHPETEAESNPIKKNSLMLKISESASELLKNRKGQSAIYLMDREVKTGTENLESDVTAGKLVCLFSVNQENTEKKTFKIISHMTENQVDLNFAFTGLMTTLAVEDPSGNIGSLTCFNLKFNLEKDNKEVLQNAFGPIISVTEKENLAEAAPELNRDLAPVMPDKNTEPASTISDEPKKNGQEALTVAIDKAKAVIHEVVTDTVQQIKTTTTEARNESIAEIKKAAQEVVEDSIQKAQVAANEASARAIEQAAASAREVSKETIQNAKAAAQEVMTTSIKQSKEAAHEVVSESISKVQTAVKETVKPLTCLASPIDCITKKATGFYKSAVNFFSPSKKKKSHSK